MRRSNQKINLLFPRNFTVFMGELASKLTSNDQLELHIFKFLSKILGWVS